MTGRQCNLFCLISDRVQRRFLRKRFPLNGRIQPVAAPRATSRNIFIAQAEKFMCGPRGHPVRCALTASTPTLTAYA
ncbi:hypothetical protein BK025_14975 [Sodalis sp. TME1]|nr:hypothetical protein BK025_14975 [Sodalis sp. TME1]